MLKKNKNKVIYHKWEILICILMLVQSCTSYRIIRYNSSGIKDYEIFENRELKASKTPFYFRENFNSLKVPPTINYLNRKNVPLHDLLKSTETTAFLIIKNDTLLFEKYFDSDTSISLSFSMAKSFLSILIGFALEDGYINSIEQPVTDFIPELASNGFKKVTLKHLLQMTSGMAYNEVGLPMGQHHQFYYTDNLEKKLLGLKLKRPPGEDYKYKSGDNQLLGLVLARALKTKTISKYMQEKIWSPLGMEYDALWSIDKEDGLEKTFCCIAAHARDFAKIGRLYLNKGNWGGTQIIKADWVKQSTKIDTTEGSVNYYQYQWWIGKEEHDYYMAVGHLGQYLYVNPKKDLIIVRLGKKRKTSKKGWEEILNSIAHQITIE